MIEVKTGNIFDSNCETLVNPVNCRGVMGAGLAKQFKAEFPDMFLTYKHQCSQGEIKPGIPGIYKENDVVRIINFPTKDFWSESSNIKHIHAGLTWFVNNYKTLNIKSIAFPALGCDLGGLSWVQVGPVMYKYLSLIPIDIEIYAPFGTGESQMSKEFLFGSGG